MIGLQTVFIFLRYLPLAESVSSFLIHLLTKLEALSTLKQMYGHPLQMFNNMIVTVRATPPRKPDRFQKLISFGLLV